MKRALAPCPNFGGDCAGIARWDPDNGYAPRGFVGALGSLDEVELVLVTAEPGDPYPGTERYPAGPPDVLLEAVCEFAFRNYETGKDLFHRNVRYILDCCFPGMTFEEQLHRTWLVDAYLCSAPVESGNVPKRSARRCTNDYLDRQLALLDGRVIAGLGAKVRDRLGWTGRPFVGVASAAPPKCNYKGSRESWSAISDAVVDRRQST
jgi:hypothetical protein